jgi:beta-galactosidase
MKKLLSILAIFAFALSASAKQKPQTIHTFTQGDGTFLLDGKPFIVKAAELHYARIPREYWDHRIKMCKALGMNAICAYVFWNYHEPQQGVWDFSGNHDLAAFMELCKKNGMWVIVRPGPYVCAEWEMGGLPWWLLKDRSIKLRTLDEKFMKPAIAFENKVAEVLAPYRLENGGNIIMVQVENEYGSYAKDKPYVSAMRDALRAAGWDKTTLFQCDWSSNFTDNALDDLVWTMNFGTGANVLDQFKKLGELRPNAPRMCSEYWSGWFDGWGRAHETRPATDMVNGISTMLDNGISFSLYMTHGGTSFGWWAGANNTGFAPDCTSYDYDAPIDEQGAATEKYYQLRELLQKHSDVKLPAVPKPLPIISIPEIKFEEMAPLFRAGNTPKAIESHDALPVEQYNQGYGNILYTTTLPDLKAGAYLRISDMCDYAIVTIDGTPVGQLYRGNGYETTLQIKNEVKAGAQLEIFIEVMGRINYSKLIHDPKGITDKVEVFTTDGKNDLTYNLKDWKVYLYPYDLDYNDLSYIPITNTQHPSPNTQPAYYKAEFSLTKTGDTYLDMRTWGKGLVWVNGHCIGRFWEVGPQQTLYIPGCWLKKGKNEIVVLDITGPTQARVEGLTKPIIDQLQRDRLPKNAIKTDIFRKSTAKKQDGGAGNDAAPGAK